MTQQYAARPTEYKGIVFRSKSEAIVARGFDLAGALWWYEPYMFECSDGYVPDFLVTHKYVDPRFGNTEIIRILFVEYKPSTPTDTYIEELCNRARECLESIPFSEFVLLIGSPFSEDIVRGAIIGADYVTSLDESHFWMCSFWEEAKKYRFDLISNNDKRAINA